MAASARNPHAILFAWHQSRAYRQLRDLLTGDAAGPPPPHQPPACNHPPGSPPAGHPSNHPARPANTSQPELPTGITPATSAPGLIGGNGLTGGSAPDQLLTLVFHGGSAAERRA